jgi:beta-lactamase regulating signal transducer with metallopeptidase domain
VQKTTGNSDILPIIEKLQLHNRVRVIQDKRIGAFCFGITSPMVYISTQMISIATPDEIEAVLRHEKYHLENNDTLVMLFAVFTESLFPFFPLLSDFISHYQTHRELQADRSAILAMKRGKDHLGSILTKLLRYDIYPAYVTTPSFVDAHTLETRIRTLIKESPVLPSLSVKNVLVSVISMMILGGLAMSPVQAIEYHDSGEDAVMACIDSNKNCFNTCQQNSPFSKYSPQSSRLYSPMVFTSTSH